jgi:hypothetical protein
MQLPDSNVRPIGFLKSLHSSPLTGRGILQHFRNINPKGLSYAFWTLTFICHLNFDICLPAEASAQAGIFLWFYFTSSKPLPFAIFVTIKEGPFFP